MKLLGKFLKNKKIKNRQIDKDTIFYIFNVIIRDEYGKKGTFNIKPSFYKNKTIFIKINNSNWANEIWLNKEEILKLINKKIGNKEILDIKIAN